MKRRRTHKSTIWDGLLATRNRTTARTRTRRLPNHQPKTSDADARADGERETQPGADSANKNWAEKTCHRPPRGHQHALGHT